VGKGGEVETKKTLSYRAGVSNFSIRLRWRGLKEQPTPTKKKGGTKVTKKNCWGERAEGE